MTTPALKKNNLLPPDLVSNLQNVLSTRKGSNKNDEQEPQPSASADTNSSLDDINNSKIVNEDNRPVVLVTNGEGIDSPGLTFLVQALVQDGLCNVHVCAPQSDKSLCGHSLSVRETIAVNSAEIDGATAFEVSGTVVDCVSLALSGALFSWSKPLLMISGINRGSSCGHQMLYSGVVAGAKEALSYGVPSISISLNWKKDESQETDFKDAVSVCLPLIKAAIRDIEKEIFPKNCLLDIEVPTSPSTNKGIKLTKQSIWRSTPSWLAVSANRHPSAGHFMSNQQSLGVQLAQLSRDASAAGAARRLTKNRPNVEVESVGVAGKNIERVKKYFRLELQFVDKEQEHIDEDLDIRALENGFIAITPVSISPHTESDAQMAASDWISTAVQADQ